MGPGEQSTGSLEQHGDIHEGGASPITLCRTARVIGRGRERHRSRENSDSTSRTG